MPEPGVNWKVGVGYGRRTSAGSFGVVEGTVPGDPYDQNRRRLMTFWLLLWSEMRVAGRGAAYGSLSSSGGGPNRSC